MAGKRVLLLGLGKQGEAALFDLVNSAEIAHVVVADNRPDLGGALSRYQNGKTTPRPLDVTNEALVTQMMRKADLVVEALPGHFALRIAELAVEAGVSLVSSMFYDDPGSGESQRKHTIRERIAQVDQKAQEAGITILSEFGLDPGIDLVLSVKALAELDEVYEFHSYGAGIPEPLIAERNPLQYKFSWSVLGVLGAYNRQAQVITGGRRVEIPARDLFAEENTHTLEIPEIGQVFECYANGEVEHYAELFGLATTIKEMGRYTCRYPGHCAFWRGMARAGFLDGDPVSVGQASVSPAQFTAAVLDSQPQFHYGEKERDLALVRLDVRGMHQGKRKRIIYQLIDHRDLNSGLLAMQRTVGFTMGLGARLILTGTLSKKGLVSPIEVPYESLVDGLAPHGIHFSRQEMDWE